MPQVPRWWAAVEAAQTTYDTLATDPTWKPAKVQTERAAASDLARLYDALSNELTGPLATALRHARNHIDHQVTELSTRLAEDFFAEDFDDDHGKAASATRASAEPACPGCTQGPRCPDATGRSSPSTTSTAPPFRNGQLPLTRTHHGGINV